MKTFLLLAMLVAGTPFTFAQREWQLPITPATPNGFPQFGADGSQQTAYDAVCDRLIVFGGISPIDEATVTQETWVLANASGVNGPPTWIRLHSRNGYPPAHFRHSAVYDPFTNRMIIFGGTSGPSDGPFLNDVWILKNANGKLADSARTTADCMSDDSRSSDWVQRTPMGGPPDARSQHGAIYDISNNAMTIFFGSNPAGTQTWSDVLLLLHANDVTNQPIWQLASQTGSVPSPVGHFAIGYDPTFGRVSLYGGCCGYSNAAFVGKLNPLSFPPTVMWTALSPSGTPAPAGDVSTFGYDQGSEKLVALDIIPGDGANGTWLLSDANGIPEGRPTDAWTNIIAGTTQGVPTARL